MTNKKFPTSRPAVVTCGLPYANGSLHLGHLLTTLSGDAFSRALKSMGQQTAFVCGSDMHGTPIAVNAHQKGETPEAFARSYHDEFAETFPKFDVEFDNYGHTHDETNIQVTREFVTSWIEGGHVYEQDIKVAWDPKAGQPLPDRYVEGMCPYCGEDARGDECDEGCQRHLEPGEIENPTSTLTGNSAEYRTRSHKFLRLSEFQEYLKGFIDRLEGTENAKNQPKEWINNDLQDLCITRDMDWGIDYPGEGEEDLVLYVWVDAPIEYVSSTKQYTEQVGTDVFNWEEAWREDGELIHIIGQDIIQHHAVFWPAMLRGAEFNEPRAIMASGFVNLRGKAFSTSRNRAIWASDYLDTGFSPDYLRYYLITAGNFQNDINFSWENLQQKTNEELVGNIGNFLYRSLLFAHRNFGGTPNPDAPPSEEIEKRIKTAIFDFRTAINDYSLKKAATVVYELSQFGNRYIQSHEPWKLVDEDPEQAKVVIRDCVQLAKAVGVLLEPFAPEGAEQLWEQLGEAQSVHELAVEAALEAPPAEFGTPTGIFEKIEDEDIEPLVAELEEMVESESDNSTNDTEVTDGSTSGEIGERIDFEEFQELDIRVGRIETANSIDGSDDLLRLDVDIGEETRQIVAGLKQFYDVEALAGKRVIVVVNLEPTTLFGVTSNGMVLAAGEEADLLTTVGDAPIGSKIK